MSAPLQIVKPNIVAPLGSVSDTPIKVKVQGGALLQLIDTIYQNDENDESQSRTVGTLLGTRSDDGSSIEVTESYIVPHTEKDDDLTIEEATHVSLYRLHKRSNPDLQVVGWFSTSPEIDTYTGLLHEFYAKGSCAPFQPILATLKYRDDETGDIIAPQIDTYISSPVGLPQSSLLARQLQLDTIGSYAFVPVPNEIIYSKNELTTLRYLSESSKKESVSFEVGGIDELTQLSKSVSEVSDLIKILTDYSKRAASGEIEGNDKIGQLLLSNLSYKPSSVDLASLEAEFKKHQDDTLLVQYLASCIKQQLDLSVKLTNFEAPEEAVN